MSTRASPEFPAREVLETLPLNVAILDADGVIVDTNRAWREFAEENGIEGSPDTIGENYLDVSEAADDEHARRAAAGLREVLAGEHDRFTMEYPCHSPTERRWFLLRAAPFVHDGDRYVTAAHIDITDRVLAEREAERRREEIASEREQLALLNQILRHDVRNDVSLITGWGELMRDHLDPEGEDHLVRILDAATHVHELTDAARDFTEIIDGSETERTPVNLAETLDDEIEKTRARYENRSTDVRITGAETIPSDVEVLATPLLSSVFSNLLHNAVLHNDKAEVEIDVAVEERAESIVVCIADNGPGIPDERKRKLFDRGHKGLESPGSGLGLYLVDKLVDIYDGSAWVEDNDPEGAVFCVELLRAMPES